MRFGYVRKSNRSAASGQLKRIVASGIGERRIFVEGKPGETFETLVLGLVDGDELVVDTLADLAATRKQLEKRLGAVHEVGCYVLELSTGHKSNITGDALKMVFKAADRIGNYRKGLTQKQARENGSKGGRPAREFTKKERRLIEKHWHDIRHPTNAAAVRAMNDAGVKIDLQQARRYMASLDGHGRSGRAPGPRREKQ